MAINPASNARAEICAEVIREVQTMGHTEKVGLGATIRARNHNCRYRVQSGDAFVKSCPILCWGHDPGSQRKNGPSSMTCRDRFRPIDIRRVRSAFFAPVLASSTSYTRKPNKPSTGLMKIRLALT